MDETLLPSFKFADRTEYMKDIRLQNIEREIEQLKKEIRELKEQIRIRGQKSNEVICDDIIY